MDAQLLSKPAEPVVVDDGSYRGYAKIARILSAMDPDRERPYSRQLVERWHKRRTYNGFPASHRVKNPESGAVKTMFVLAEVVAWHLRYRDTHNVSGSPERRTLTTAQRRILQRYGIDAEQVTPAHTSAPAWTHAQARDAAYSFEVRGRSHPEI